MAKRRRCRRRCWVQSQRTVQLDALLQKAKVREADWDPTGDLLGPVSFYGNQDTRAVCPWSAPGRSGGRCPATSSQSAGCASVNRYAVPSARSRETNGGHHGIEGKNVDGGCGPFALGYASRITAEPGQRRDLSLGQRPDHHGQRRRPRRDLGGVQPELRRTGRRNCAKRGFRMRATPI